MSHLMFFSYGRENYDPLLADFFKDLCSEIAPLTKWGPESENISFRDKDNLRLMERWEPPIQEALQSSSVLVCITSTLYFNRPFCGKEYYIFDQRRRQSVARDKAPPPTILPVIWAPVAGGLPPYMQEQQVVPQGVADTYLTSGLRRLMRFDRNAYEQCLVAFADAIVDAAAKYKIPRLAYLQPFEDIPNHFAGGDWQEAGGPGGWVPGPEVANFVFAAGSDQEFPLPTGRYGPTASQWRPYLPPEPDTVLRIAKTAARGFKFREIPVDETLKRELERTRDRKNLTVVLADPLALRSQTLPHICALEDVWWEGSALVLPCDDQGVKWDDAEMRQAFRSAFPVVSQLGAPTVQGPIRTGRELQLSLETTLASLRSAVTKAESDKREKTDEPPPGVTALPGVAT